MGTGGGIVGVEQWLVSPDGRQHRQAGLHVDAHIAAVDRQRKWLGGRQPVAKFSVHQQSPDIAECDVLANQVLDVDTAVAQGTAVLIGLGDLGGECHHPLETGNEILRDLVRDDSHGGILPRDRAPVATGR